MHSIQSLLHKILFVFILPFSMHAMEQQEQSSFDLVPSEIKQAVVLAGVSVCADLKDVPPLIASFKLISKEWNAYTEDPLIVPYIVKKLHKKFNIKKLDALYIFHTKAALEKLQAKMTLITKYAFLYHNTLLHQNGGIENLSPETQLPPIILEYAYKDLHKQKVNNPNFWQIIKNIDEVYLNKVKTDSINVALDAYQDITTGKPIAARLLYLSENIQIALSTVRLKSFLKDKNLFSSLALHAFNVFYPDQKRISPQSIQIMERINPIEESY